MGTWRIFAKVTLHKVNDLAEMMSGRQSAFSQVYVRKLIMFKITQKTVRLFSFTEILIMAAMNELEKSHKA